MKIALPVIPAPNSKNYSPKKGDTIEPSPGCRFASLEKYKWKTGMVIHVTPKQKSAYDDAEEIRVICVVDGVEVTFWEFSDNVRLKTEIRY